MQGKEIKRWKVFNHPSKLLPGGSVMGTKRMRETESPFMREAIELVEVSWDGAERWSYAGWDDDGTGQKMSRQHHDFQRQGNPVGYFAPGQRFKAKGNTLVLSHKTVNEPTISKYPLMDDVIYEVDHAGKSTGFIWYPSKHVEDMGFSKEARAEIAKDHRLDGDLKTSDWLHINSVSWLGKNRWYDKNADPRFHPDNIIIDSREANFILIISRATGKIVWRVGPEYDKSTPWHEIGQLIGPHHAHIIPEGLPGAGNILVFDNGGYAGYGGPEGFPRHRREYSRVVEFDPTTYKVVWEYGVRDGPDRFYSAFVSSAQRLPNGNTLVTEGDGGKMFEVTRDKQVVWRWASPAIAAKQAFGFYRGLRVPAQWLPAGINPAGYDRWGAMSCNVP